MKPTLNIVGCGQVGKTLGHLLAKYQCYQVQSVLCRTSASSLAACHFIGCGQPVTHYEDLQPADVTLLAPGDDQLQAATLALAKSPSLKPGTIVFHCSGSFTHEILSPLVPLGVLTASLHPLKSFSDPKAAVQDFKGTYCTLEGAPQACQTLTSVFETMGGKIMKIPTDNKILYHIAAIFSSNYLVTLIETSLNLLTESGIPRTEGLALLQPLITGTLTQVYQKDTAQALTGPIARGESELVHRQYHTLKTQAPEIALAYQVLGKLTLKLAAKNGRLDEATIETLQTLFS